MKLAQKPKLKETKIKLTAYNSTKIHVLGKCILRVLHKRKMVPIMFIVAETDSMAILGLDTCEQLNLVKRIMLVNKENPDIMQEFSDCFGEIGTLPKIHHIHVNPEIKPVVHPPRRVPIALHQKLKAELDRMENLNIIERVFEPTEWVNSLVVVQKPNGKLRICLDPKDLNKAIKRHYHHIPTAEDILFRMAGATVFSKLDASSGYWQIQVDEVSSKLLTFNSPFGRYKFKRLPFGVLHSSEVFQADVAEILEGIEGVQNAQDDIMVWGKTKTEHDNRLRNVLRRIRDYGLKLNKDKCIFNVSEVTYIGHTLTSEGVKPDPRKTKAITEMQFPQSKHELRTFLGMINYLGKFVPNLSDITAPLREMLEKDCQWYFDKVHERAFNKLKSIVTSNAVLKYYDPKLDTKVSTDASKSGLGASLQQKHGNYWLPVAFANRAMTQTEQSYCQIEKETLSIVFGCEKFHQFVYGRQFEVENDHQPLKPIFGKPIFRAPPRIQRFMLRLQRYDFMLEYKPGKEMIVADALSRNYLKEVPKQEIPDSEMDYVIHAVISDLPISQERLNQFKEETEKDETLQLLSEYVRNGWPRNRDSVVPEVKPYYNVRDEITLARGLVLKSSLIIVPTSMRKEMKKLIHQGHQGIEKCRLRARTAFYWPGMSSEIEELVSSCATCLEHRNYQQKEELIQHDVPSSPWMKVGLDLFTLKNKKYMLIVDYYSKYIEICLLPNTSSPTIIKYMKSIFARHGIPKTVISDNPFDTAEFKKFQREWDFKLTTSSPYHPKSNGMAERNIQTVKRVLRKAFANKEDPYLALLALRTTPISNDSVSPAAKLMGRDIRTTLPAMKATTYSADTQKVEYTKKYYNQQCKNVPELKVGDTVRLRQKTYPRKFWDKKGTVVAKLQEPRSYKVEAETGKVYRCNRRDILKTKETFNKESQIPDSDVEISSDETPSVKESIDTSATLIPRPPPEESKPVHYRSRYGRVIKPPQRYEPGQ